jgi:hypothetical protein
LRHFCQIAQGVDVLPLVFDIYRQPELWNAHTERTQGDSPHRAVDDIWCRFRAREELVSRESYAEPFVPVMYPAWHALPHLRPLVFALMTRLEAVQLGIVLITRVPAGKECAPHDDRGRWAAEFMNMKVAVPLASNPQCLNTCEDEVCRMNVGEAWCFENQVVHSTVNHGETDRITLLVSMRVE